MTFLIYSRALAGQRFYEEDLAALKIATGSDDCRLTSSFLEALSSDRIVVGYFYTYSSILAFLRSLLGGKTLLTGGLDFLSFDSGGGFWRILVLKSKHFLLFLGCLGSVRVLPVSRYDYNALKSQSYLRFFLKKIHLSLHSFSESLQMSQMTRTQQPWVNSSYDGMTVCWQGHEENVIRKGVDRAVKLYNRLHLEGVEAALHIVGRSGHGTPYLASLISSCCRPDLFLLHDYVDSQSLRDLYLSIPFYLQLSRMEGFGMSLAEAALYGARIICTNVGGIPDSRGRSYLPLSENIVYALDHGRFIFNVVSLFNASPSPGEGDRLFLAQVLSSSRRAASFSF